MALLRGNGNISLFPGFFPNFAQVHPFLFKMRNFKFTTSNILKSSSMIADTWIYKLREFSCDGAKF